MNNKKIAFITCVNDDILYDECLRYIGDLEIPEGYEIDVISVREAKSITSAYNNAMNSTDAKYKVYLHQDTLIINKYFIKNILEIFNSDKNIGMIGMVGCENIPINAVWCEANKKYGKVYESHTGNMQLLAFDEIVGAHEEVKAIDGFIMITQHDIEWREDLFDGWHFYDISQSVEFIKNGYKVVIPNQKKCWCIHECGLSRNGEIYTRYKETFLKEYSRDIFPLVSVLIPTYNRPEYLELALQSVINQTYPNIEIIIGDDSTNNDTEKIIADKYLHKYNNIKYYHNSENLGQFDNYLKLMELANGEYINFLMDDDLFELTKIEKMMKYFIDDIEDEISLVTSHRGVIDSDGEFKGVFGNTNNLINNDTILNGYECGNFALINNFNFLGEPTTVLFKKSKLTEQFGIFNGRRYGCNVDMATWLTLLSNGKAIFINEILSYFRVFENQQSCSIKMKILGALDYINEVLTSRQKNFLNNDNEYIQAVHKCKEYCEYVIVNLKDKEKNLNDYLNLEEQYNTIKNEYDIIQKDINKRNQDELFNFDKNKGIELIEENKRAFNKYIDLAKLYLNKKNYEQVSKVCFEAATFAVCNHPGEYYSHELEEMLIECSASLPRMNYNKKNSSKKRILHVLSEGYAVGGHTRLVKNWIYNDNKTEHSLISTWQNNTTPAWLLDEIKNSGGKIHSLENESTIIEKAIMLRKIAYEYADIVVLHIHMQDIIPIIAFGVEGGPPVVFMNHADHMFWVGTSITDKLLDLRQEGIELSVSRRNVDRNCILPIPLELPVVKAGKKYLRNQLGIDESTTILLTVASEYKFKTLGNIHYLDIMKKVIEKHLNTILVVIGPDNSGIWEEAYNETNGRILPMGIRNEINSYYEIADIYVDSCMFCSITSALDAGLRGMPIVSLKNKNSEILSFGDIAYNKEHYELESFYNYIDKLISDLKFRNNEGKELLDKIKKIHCDSWTYYLEDVYNVDEHRIYSVKANTNMLENRDIFWALFQNKK